MLEKIRPAGATTDHLFIGTLRFQYFTVVWNPETRQLDTVQSFVDVAERHVAASQSRDRCHVDPTGRQLVMELFEGILNLVKIVKPRKEGMGYLDTPEQIRITELKVRAMTFLYTETKQPKLAILYDTAKNPPDLRLATYRVTDEKGQYLPFDPNRNRENDIGDLDMGASHLIPVPKGEVEQRRYIVRNAASAKAQLGGVIVVGETKMTYLDDESKAIVEYALEEASIFVAWERYDDLNYLLADDYARLHLLTLTVDGAVVTGMRMTYLDDESKAIVEYALEEASIFVAWERYDDLNYLLADDYARLHLLTLTVDGAVVTGMRMRVLGKITKATVMVHMGDGVLYIASHEGDSQVVRLSLEPDEPSIEVLQTMANVAPILDFAVMDMGGRDGETQTNEYSSGQARLVTGSGAWEGGSLRSIRSGVGLEDVGILADMEDISGLFSLRSNEGSQADDIAIVSFPVETRVFKFDSQGEVEELESFRGFSLDQPTLLARNLPRGLMLQVTTSSATLLGTNGIGSRWTPPPGQTITAASASDDYLMLSANGVTLVSLDIQRGLQEVAVQNLGNENQVACIHVPDQIPNIGAVGFWKSGSVSILNLTNLEVLYSEDLRRIDSTSIPRNIALTQVLPEAFYGPTLFVAMEDGIVLTFNVDKSDYSLSGRKSIVLGTQQAQFQILPRKDGLFNVFATCEHPSLIYGSEGRIVYSAVTAENATHVCSFNSEAYPNSIVVATPENLKISQIDSERRTHVRTLPIGETVRRLCYSPKERAFGIGCIKRELVKGEEIITNSFRLVEDVVFGEMGRPFILRDTNGDELIECIIRAELPTEYGDKAPVERFIVGTSYVDDETKDTNVGGRILVFGVDSESNPYLVMSHVLKGACRTLAILDGKIVAGLVKTVVMYRYEETTEASARLVKLATYRTSTCPIALDVSGNIIAVGDVMKSISLVEYTPGKEGLPDKLEEVARHMESSWTTSVAHIEGHSYLTSDQYGNLLVLRRNVNGVTLEDRKRMEMTSEMNLGEPVNKIVQIQVEPSPNAMVIPKAFLATVSCSPPIPTQQQTNLPPLRIYRPKDPSTSSP
jgi:DNA damage-binding protein 1